MTWREEGRTKRVRLNLRSTKRERLDGRPGILIGGIDRSHISSILQKTQKTKTTGPLTNGRARNEHGIYSRSQKLNRPIKGKGCGWLERTRTIEGGGIRSERRCSRVNSLSRDKQEGSQGRSCDRGDSRSRTRRRHSDGEGRNGWQLVER